MNRSNRLLVALAILACSGCATYAIQETTISNAQYGWTVTHKTGPKRLTKTLEMKVDPTGVPTVLVEVEQVETQATGILGAAMQFLGIWQ